MASRWLYSTNAKDIGTLYLIFSVFTGLLGTAFSVLIRLELSAPGNQYLEGNHQMYNVIATTHGIMMIYFMVVPSMAGFANYFAPVLVGAPDIKNKNNNENNQFSSYLAGLWEGDGHVWIPKTTHAPSGKRYSPHFCITFGNTELPLVKALQTLIGGYIRYKNDNTVVLVITKKDDLINVINLISSYIRTPKIAVLNNLVDWINVNLDTKLAMLFLDKTPLNENSWLAGFIDADGSFRVIVRYKTINEKSKNRVAVEFRLEQQIMHSGVSFGSVLALIAETFGVTLGTSSHYGTQYYIISIHNLVSTMILVKYLDNHKLFTSKRLNYQDYRTCVEIMINDQHLSQEGREKAEMIKQGINRKRTHYNWNHLSELGILLLTMSG